MMDFEVVDEENVVTDELVPGKNETLVPGEISETGLVKLSDLSAIPGSQKIITNFTPKVQELNALYPEYEETLTGYKKEVGTEQYETAPEEKQIAAAGKWGEKAKKLRSSMVKIRTSTQTVHDDVKKEYLPVTKAIDAVSKTIKDASQEAESVLQFIVDTDKRIEELHRQKKEAERTALLSQVSDGNPLPVNLGVMDDMTWDAVYTGWKAKHEAAVKARIEEEERQKKERLNADRKIKAAPLAEYIPNFVTMDFSGITEDEYSDILKKAHETKQEKEKEREADSEKLREEAKKNYVPPVSVTPVSPVTPEVPVMDSIPENRIQNKYLSDIKKYLFDKMMNAPDPETAVVINKAMEVLG